MYQGKKLGYLNKGEKMELGEEGNGAGTKVVAVVGGVAGQAQFTVLP